MQKVFLLCCLSFFSFINAKSQATVRFCATVYQNGECVLQNTKFFSSQDSITQKVSMLAANQQGFGTDSIFFEMSSIDKNGVEKFYSSLSQGVENDWIYAWKTVYFESPGRYAVRILNRQKQLQAQGTFELYLP